MDLTLAIRGFNEKVRILNQTNGKHVVLTPQEARGLHTDIMTLLARYADAVSNTGTAESTQITMDGGGFK